MNDETLVIIIIASVIAIILIINEAWYRHKFFHEELIKEYPPEMEE